ncbi:VWA domain-containing protein [Pontibacter sp. G13]|uniref:vWA domain-containing protein n=1 Tax=Pontibacter sp. G13 TaxID=3074898 RepID=UPI00288B23B6|nr:VWA domain-containing protein [Pontibacter sp. G13]WNJ16971.1 VWA domain-containing protein [Pontibacter sp. G13]
MEEKAPLDDRLKRWRMILGGGEADGTEVELDAHSMGIDRTLEALYDANSSRSGGLGSSKPYVNRWLGDIRTYFPSSVVQVLQRDAMERLGLKQMLLEPEILEHIEPDVHLAATLVSLKQVIPERTKSTARQVVQRIVDDLLKRLQLPMIQAVKGALSRHTRNIHPKLREIDWPRTIAANLKHYQPEYGTVIPERLIGMGRKGSALKEVILCVDQSGSMATSVVYASVFGAVMASMQSIKTRMVAFDTEVADMTEMLSDPVDLLFGVQLGGGTDICRALAYCESWIHRPKDTILVLISDLYEGGNRRNLIKQAMKLKASGVQFITLLALSDEGKPFYDAQMAQEFADLKIPTFGCTPDAFPGLMAAAIQGTRLPLEQRDFLP